MNGETEEIEKIVPLITGIDDLFVHYWFETFYNFTVDVLVEQSSYNI